MVPPCVVGEGSQPGFGYQIRSTPPRVILSSGPRGGIPETQSTERCAASCAEYHRAVIHADHEKDGETRGINFLIVS